MANKVEANWHKDAAGHTRPTDMVGKRYFHPKTGHLYEVVGTALDAERGVWMVTYMRVTEDRSPEVNTFVHTLDDFRREGRFMEVKQ